MCVESIYTEYPVARKNHKCDACEWLRADFSVIDGELTFAELRVIAKAKKNNFKIKKGDKYLRFTGKMEGEIYTFKAIPEIHEICHKLDVYQC